MQITDVLAQMGGLRSMARELGISESQAATGAETLIPAILGGFKKQAQAQPSGLEGLGGLLGQLGGGGLLDNVLSPQPTDVNRGNDVLGQILAPGRQPHGRAERGVALGARPGPAQEDAADPGDAGGRLHGEAARSGRPSARAAGGLGDVLGGLLGGGAARASRAPRRRAGSRRCST